MFKWKYHAGNNWNSEPTTGESIKGIGAQEEFYGCADVRITDPDGQSVTQKPIVTTNKLTTKNVPVLTSKKQTASTVTTKKKPTTKAATTNGQTDDKCFNGDGFYADKASDCKKFYRCFNGKISNFECGAGTLLDETISTCNHQGLVKCD